MNFEKFKERKEFALRVALIDLMDKQSISEKYVSVAKELAEKKDDISNINTVEFIKKNPDLKLNNKIKSYLYRFGKIETTDVSTMIGWLASSGKFNDENFDLIKSLLWNNNIRGEFDLKFKKHILDMCRRHSADISNFKNLPIILTRYGKVDMELINLIMEFPDNKMNIDDNAIWFISSNDGISLDVIEQFSDRNIDWLAISYREDLTIEFILNHSDKLCLEIILMNIEYSCELTMNSRYSTLRIKKAIDGMKGKSKETIKSECYIKYHIDKINGGWDAVSRSMLMSDDFMIQNWDKLNKDMLKKYRVLSDRIQKLL